MIAVLKGETRPDFYPMFAAWTEKYKVAVAAAGIVAATALAPSAVASASDPYLTLRAQRENLLAQYDRIWKGADDIKYEINQIERSSNRDPQTLTDLDNDLKRNYDQLRKIEQDLRDLDKAMI
jgi:septal ring factor EnvC (AmiA/AmiB activator)